MRNADTHVRGDLTPCGSLYFAGDGDGKAIVWHVQSGSIQDLAFESVVTAFLLISALKYAEYSQLSLAQCPVTCVSYHPFDHWVAFAVYGLRQPILVYKHDSSGKPRLSSLGQYGYFGCPIIAPELHKEEPTVKPVEKKEGPVFDPDYSLAKLLEEHRLLTKVDLPTGRWSGSNRKGGAMTPSPSAGNLQAGRDTSKKGSQNSDPAGVAGKVSLGVASQSSTRTLTISFRS